MKIVMKSSHRSTRCKENASLCLYESLHVEHRLCKDYKGRKANEATRRWRSCQWRHPRFSLPSFPSSWPAAWPWFHLRDKTTLPPLIWSWFLPRLPSSLCPSPILRIQPSSKPQETCFQLHLSAGVNRAESLWFLISVTFFHFSNVM